MASICRGDTVSATAGAALTRLLPFSRPCLAGSSGPELSHLSSFLARKTDQRCQGRRPSIVSADALAVRQRRRYKTACQTCVGVWLSLVEHLVRDEGVADSNPATPTST